MAKAKIGVIGGSGLYTMPGLEKAREVRITTPFGKPSDAYILGVLEGRPCAFLSRHGRGHVISPSEINFRANIYGFKKLGVERIISVSAVGSLREDFRPTDMALPTQFVDRTRQRISTFFGNGLVAHIGFDTPVCPTIVEVLAESCADLQVPFHKGGNYLCMEGPAFSTKAESNLYRSWGMDIIGMTSLQEAKLAREAEICYAVLAMVTDYDCWHPGHDAVTVTQILDYLSRNVENSQTILRLAVRSLPEARACKCATALAHAIITDRKKIPAATRRKLALLVGKYLKK
ncbi:MAG TPA: S-methyl-5'-thioadenosine phosphorylase [Terriglobia bacterium]|nr:S-methyl-5'-thioadenosine phosphorylase [Terriglobia bacterium]